MKDSKIIDFKGKSLRISKFNPLDGCYILQQVLSSFMPDVFEKQIEENRPFKPTRSLSKDEFNELLTTCCKNVVYLQKIPVPVNIPLINENGSFAVGDFDFSDYFLITMEVLAFNLLSFFTAENLKRLLGIFKQAEVLILGAQIVKSGVTLE
jgi:hypothetical protein